MNHITSTAKKNSAATNARRSARVWRRMLGAIWNAMESGPNALMRAPHGRAALTEALESRQLLSFDVTIAAPGSVTAGQQFYVYAWTSGGTMSGNYTVNQGDGNSFSYAPSPTSRVTAIPVTYAPNALGNFTLTVQATDAAGQTVTQSYGLDDAGNYPANRAGPTTYIPTGETPSTNTVGAAAVAMDPVTGDRYVADSYYNSSAGWLMGLTRLDSNGLPDTSFGTLVSGSTYTGTFLVPAFSGGADVPYAAAVLDAGGVDEVALAGYSLNGMAVAVVDVSGSGAVIGTSDYGSQTMPSGAAYAVMFDSSNDVIAAGATTDCAAMTAVALYGITDAAAGETTGELDSSFAGGGVCTVNFGTGTDAAACAILQEPDSSHGGNSDLVLGGWISPGSEGCQTGSCCMMTVVGLDDSPADPNTRGGRDTSNFGCEILQNGQTTGINEAPDLSVAAATAGFNGCYGSTGCLNCCGSCSSLSTDSVYSLAWDDEIASGSIVAIGGTNYSGANQFAIWSLNANGTTNTSFGGYNDGLTVPNVNATAAGGAVDTYDSPAAAYSNVGTIWLAGTMNGDIFIGRLNADGSFDTTFGTYDPSSGGAQGYFTQDLGTASSNTWERGVGIATGNDGTVTVIGDSGGGNVAVAQYFDQGQITVTAPPISLIPVADAYTSSNPYNGTNYGSATDLQVENSSTGDIRNTYLTFDLSSIAGNILDVQLRLYGGLTEPSSDGVTADVVPITASWSEGTITGDNAPANAGGPVASTIINSNAPQWYNWDLTGYIRNELAAGVTQISLAVEADSATAAPLVDMNSREASSNMPQLAVATDSDTLSTTQDAYVRAGTYADSNYGSSTELDIKNNPTSGDNRVTYMTFDTSPISDGITLSAAMVQLFGEVAGTTDTGITVTAYPVADTAWDQGTLTWNTAPAYDTANPLASATITNTTPSLYSWDITSYLDQQRVLGHNVVSIALVSTSSTTDYLSFSSSRAGSNKPDLWISEAGIQAPQLMATNTQVQISWQPVPGAASYAIYRSDSVGSLGSLIATGITGLTFTDTTVTAGNTYGYVVVALNSAGGTISQGSDSNSGGGTDVTGTNLSSGGGGGDNSGGGGLQTPITVPIVPHQIGLSTAWGQPNIAQAISTHNGVTVSTHNKPRPANVGVQQFNPNWGQLLSTSSDLTYITNYSYDTDWDTDPLAPPTDSVSASVGWAIATSNNVVNASQMWADGLIWVPPPSSGSFHGQGDGGGPGVVYSTPGFHEQMISVWSQLNASTCPGTDCTIESNYSQTTIEGMFSGVYTVTYDYIPS